MWKTLALSISCVVDRDRWFFGSFRISARYAVDIDVATLQFGPPQDTGIAYGHESAVLSADLVSGQSVDGTDLIRTVGCRGRFAAPV